MTINRELFQRDPSNRTLANDGVARVSAIIDPVMATEELEMFVCEGQYEVGLTNLLQTYVNNFSKSAQPSGWVSGFFGSGKSHLVKVLRYLWTNEIISDGKRARDLATLPTDVTDLLKELDGRAKQAGGVFACSGVLDSAAAAGLPGKVAGIVLTHLGLPAEPMTARFVLRLRAEGLETKLKEALGDDYDGEILDFRISDDIAVFMSGHLPSLGSNPAAVLDKLNANYPSRARIDIDGMVALINEAVLQRFGTFPCTLIVLDEAQQFIGENPDRRTDLQNVAEALSKQFNGRIMVVATGQSALNTTENLRKLQDRFTRQIQLQDKDIDTVIRNVVLRKKPDRRSEIESCMSTAEGEITRQLKNTRLETHADDKARYVDDYPILPARRRFWDRFLRSVETGLTGQLRTQLRMTLEAVKKIADKPLGTVVTAETLFDQLATVMVENGVLDRQQSNDIQKLLTSRDPDHKLKGRLCSLIFMIQKLPREPGTDLGVRATADTLSDLLVDDLAGGGHVLRQRIPTLLAELEADGVLMAIGDEFQQQTTESAQWESSFRKHLQSIRNSPSELPTLIADTLRGEVTAICDKVKIRQGKSKVNRNLAVSFSDAAPVLEDGVTIWVRTGWESPEKTFATTIESRGPSDPLVALFITKEADDELRSNLATKKAAELTLAERGAGAQSPAAIQARSAIESKRNHALLQINTLLTATIMPKAKVFLAGSNDHEGLNIEARIESAVKAALIRLFPQFSVGDSDQWDNIFKQAKSGATTPLSALGFNGNPEDQPVCKAVHAEVGAGKKGTDLRRKFTSAPYGWPSVTVDGAIMVLLSCELLKAFKNHQPVSKATIELSTVGVHEFKTDAPPITVHQKMRIKGICAAVGVLVPVNDDLDLKAEEALKALIKLAQEAGGEAPLPLSPGTNHIKALQATAGNAMLAEMDAQADTLKAQADQWKKLAELKRKRLPKWASLQLLLAAAKDAGLPVYDKVAPQAKAINDNRQLLGDLDPMPLYIKDLTEVLAKELTARHAAAVEAHDLASAALARTTEWATLGTKDPAVRDNLVVTHKLKPIEPIAADNEDQLLAALKARSLSGWTELAQALPTRFAAARADAAMSLQPKARQVKLRQATISTTAELDAWLAESRAAIAKELDAGNPVIL